MVLGSTILTVGKPLSKLINEGGNKESSGEEEEERIDDETSSQ